MEKIKLKPRFTSLRIPDPKTGKPIPSDGCEVEKNPYWMRRLKDGDCILVESKNSEDGNGSSSPAFGDDDVSKKKSKSKKEKGE